MLFLLQVVQGMEYKVTMSTVESSCSSSGDSMGLTASDCAISDGAMDGVSHIMIDSIATTSTHC